MAHSRNKPNQQILDEAAEWFVDVREGDLDASAEKAFTQWLRRSPEHIGAYMEVAAFWADVPNLVAKENVDFSALIAYARDEDNIVPLAGAGRPPRGEYAKPDGAAITAQMTTAASPTPSNRAWKRCGWIAACFAIVVIGVALWSFAQSDTYSTEVGEQRSVLLKDGSMIELNARSRVRVHFTDEVRRIELLEGQALFHVAKDPTRPLVVTSGGASVRAVGTQFDVNQKKAGTTVTVIEGRVAVAKLPVPGPTSWVPSFSTPRSSSKSVEAPASAGSVPVLLSAGEQLVVSTKMPMLPKTADISAATAWTRRQLIFQGAPLAEVVEEFNRYNPRQMKIMDETLQSVRISGVFSSTQPASLLLFLKDQVFLKITEDDESIRISRR